MDILVQSTLGEDISVALFWDDDDEDEKGDLDISAVCFDPDGNFVDAIYYNQLNSKKTNEAILHSGDINIFKTVASYDQVSNVVMPDEKITVDIDDLPKNIHYVIILISAANCELSYKLHIEQIFLSNPQFP